MKLKKDARPRYSMENERNRMQDRVSTDVEKDKYASITDRLFQKLIINLSINALFKKTWNNTVMMGRQRNWYFGGKVRIFPL